MLFLRKQTPVQWIVVFLGNPGSRYERTRHNAGFLAADVVEKQTGVRINRVKFKSLTAVTLIGARQVLLMKPQTFMNLSGDAVKAAMSFYKTALQNVITVSDDVSLPAGKIRVRRSGSAGGHNGLGDIIGKCGGDGFPRVRIGVGAPPRADYDMADWVLSKLPESDRKLIAAAASRAAEAVAVIIDRGIEPAMSEFNGSA